jgi:hypothetical protein
MTEDDQYEAERETKKLSGICRQSVELPGFLFTQRHIHSHRVLHQWRRCKRGRDRLKGASGFGYILIIRRSRRAHNGPGTGAIRSRGRQQSNKELPMFNPVGRGYLDGRAATCISIPQSVALQTVPLRPSVVLIVILLAFLAVCGSTVTSPGQVVVTPGFPLVEVIVQIGPISLT